MASNIGRALQENEVAPDWWPALAATRALATGAACRRPPLATSQGERAVRSLAARECAARSPGWPRVFVVHPDISVRRALKSLIDRAGWQPYMFAAASEFLRYPRIHAPSCLLLAIDLKDSSGFDLQARVSERSDLPIIFTADHADVPTTVRAIKAGALEFFTQPWDPSLLVRAIEQALERSRTALERQSARCALEAGYASLSRRERQVMALVVTGLLNKQVGNALGISEVTVKAHRGQVMRKMKAGSLAGLVRMAAALDVEARPTR